MSAKHQELRSRLRAVAATASVVVGAIAMTAALPGVAAAEKLVFGNPNPRGMNVGMAPIHYAMEMGFFEEEGLELEFVNFQGSGVLFPQLANKAVDVGWPNPDVLIKSHQPDQDSFPVVFFYNHLRSYVWEIVVPESSGITEIKDLKGKRLGVNTLVTGNIPTTQSILREAGLDPEKDIEMIPVGMGASAFEAMRSDRIDALNLFDTMHAMLENTGFPLRRLDFPRKYRDLFANGFATHKDNLTDKREAMIGFGRAIAKGTVGCFANLEACVRIVWKLEPGLRPKEGEEEAKLRNDINVLKTRGASYWAFEGEAHGNWGAYPDGSWQQFVDVLHETGELKTRELPVSEMYSNELVPEMNDFDPAAIEQQAKDLKP